jgi:hypothetical protein
MPINFKNISGIGSTKAKRISSGITKFYSLSTPTIITSNLLLNMDANNASSYPGSGTSWFDISGNSRVATLSGYSTSAPTFTSGTPSYFNFTRSGVLTGNSAVFSLTAGGTSWADLTSTVTLSIWFYTGTSAVMIIAGKGFRTTPSPTEFQAYQFYTNGSSIVARVTAGGTTSNVDVSTSFSFNTWTNITLTYNGSTVALYKNGILANSSAKTGAITSTLNWPFVIGGQYNANNAYNLPADFFNGRIGQLLLYSSALSSTDVLYNYNLTKATYGL